MPGAPGKPNNTGPRRTPGASRAFSRPNGGARSAGPKIPWGRAANGEPRRASNTSWGRVADWYHGLVEDENSYQQKVILPNLLRLLDIQPGERLLDLACGEGIFTREFARGGAHVTGADISPELIAIARDNASWNIRYEIASADRVPAVPKNSIDTVTVILALQNIADLNAVFEECARVLTPEGRLIIVMNHPAFRIPKASSWEWDERAHILYRRLDKYLSESRALIQMHPGDDPREVTTSFHRPLQTYFKALANNGFAVRRLEEWISNRKSQAGPRAIAEDKARKEFPLFLAVEAIRMADSSSA